MTKILVEKWRALLAVLFAAAAAAATRQRGRRARLARQVDEAEQAVEERGDVARDGGRAAATFAHHVGQVEVL